MNGLARLATAAAFAAAAISAAPEAGAAVIGGTVTDWLESSPAMTFGDGTNSVSFFWSINTFDRGFFYGSDWDGSDVAIATGVTDINQITDASIFDFRSDHVGPVCDADCSPTGIGTFLVYRNATTNYYGAFRIDDIKGNQAHDAYLDMTWWFQTDGSASFVVPLPAGGMLLLSGLAGLGLMRRRHGA